MTTFASLLSLQGLCFGPMILAVLGLSAVACGSSSDSGASQPPVCESKSCLDFFATCGEIPDNGCGMPLSCGTCAADQQCGNAVTKNACVPRECLPTTCQALGKNCGEVDNGCGQPLQCGSCGQGETCGGKGVPNQCGAGTCTPVTCADLGASCGVVSDGCSKTLQCGDCKAGETCGGGGKSNVCGAGACVPKTCGQVGANCGTTDDGCGKTLDCGACSAPQTCGGGGTANVCGGGSTCVPKTCASEGKNCGELDDGCGAKVPCGTCTAPMTCGGGGVPLVCGAGAPATWKAISAGSFHSCGVRADGSLWCWGNNDSGQLGNGTNASSPLPVKVSSNETWSAVAAGGLHTCAITTQGKLYCWGSNNEGQLGDLSYNSHNTPTLTEPSVEEPSLAWEEVQAGAKHTCGRKGWYVYCFGDNSRGQLALGDYDSRNQPTQVILSGILSVGMYHSCVITSSAVNDTVFCAGANDYFQLGQLSPSQSPSFLAAQSPNSFPTWQYVAAGGRHTCAGYLSQLYCWGSNDKAQLGSPNASGQWPEVISFSTYGISWVKVIAGDSHMCAMQDPDKLFCWGANDAGQLGIGNQQQKDEPVEVGSGWKVVSLGYSHSCGIKNDGSLLCWGDNSEGQLGLGGGSVNVPTQLP
ncbi:MAG: hypothetical protein HY898_31725 [Deltaproteobacteria bacterium]|nr:hypothetical protein [Deltaproteobacteria bacterium]